MRKTQERFRKRILLLLFPAGPPETVSGKILPGESGAVMKRKWKKAQFSRNDFAGKRKNFHMEQGLMACRNLQRRRRRFERKKRELPFGMKFLCVNRKICLQEGVGRLDCKP